MHNLLTKKRPLLICTVVCGGKVQYLHWQCSVDFRHRDIYLVCLKIYVCPNTAFSTNIKASHN